MFFSASLRFDLQLETLSPEQVLPNGKKKVETSAVVSTFRFAVGAVTPYASSAAARGAALAKSLSSGFQSERTLWSTTSKPASRRRSCSIFTLSPLHP